MTQYHADLLAEAVNSNYNSRYICDKLNFVTDYEGGCDSVIDLINKWLKENGGYHPDDGYVKYSFDYTQYAKDGMTREEWVETILAPLALALPEENV